MIADQFIGVWELIPYKSISQFGAIPQSCTYTISFVDGMGTLQIDMDWVEGNGQKMSGNYQVSPDGLQYENPGQGSVDNVMSEMKGMRVLNTTAFYKGKIVSFASREILGDGSMKITQQGINNHGLRFENIQYFRKMR